MKAIVLKFVLGYLISSLGMVVAQTQETAGDIFNEIELHNPRVLFDPEFVIRADSKDGTSKISFLTLRTAQPLDEKGDFIIGMDINIGIYFNNNDNLVWKYDHKYLLGVGRPIYKSNGTIVGVLALGGMVSNEGIDYSYDEGYSTGAGNNFTELKPAVSPRIIFFNKSIRANLSYTRVFLHGKDSDIIETDITSYDKVRNMIWGVQNIYVLNHQSGRDYTDLTLFATKRIAKSNTWVGPEIGAKNGRGYYGLKVRFNFID